MLDIIIMCVCFLTSVYTLYKIAIMYLDRKYPPILPINDLIQSEVASIKRELFSVRDSLSDYAKMKEDLKDIQSKSNQLQIGKAFMPSRRS